MKIIDSIFKEKKENCLDFRHQYQNVFKFVDDGVAVLMAWPSLTRRIFRPSVNYSRKKLI